MSKGFSKYNLPKGWVWTIIGELGIVTSGGTPSTREHRYWGGEIPWISPADLSGYDGKYISSGKRNISKEGLDESSAKLLPSGSLLFSSRAPIGYVAIAKNEIATNQGFKNLILTKSIGSDYIYYFLKSANQIAQEMASGTTFLELSASKFAQIPIPLPPLQEQYRITEKIEQLFSELDNSISQLNLARNQLKVYNQVLLKQAFEGKLTEQWRKENNPEPAEELLKRIKEEKKVRYEQELKNWKDSVKKWENEGKNTSKPRKPPKPVEYPKLKKEDLDKFPTIPDSWIWVKNNELLYYVTSGSRDWKKYYSNTGSYFIRTQDIKTNSLELSNAANVDLPETAEGKRSLVEKGDLLMTITGANVGKIAIIDQEIPEAYVSQSVALMKPVKKEIAPYLHSYFQSTTFGSRMINELVYGVGRPVLSLENMREAAVAMPSLEEQKIIIKEIDSQFSIIEKLEIEVNNGITKTEALRQSILKRAFEGKLIEQSPNDEPATELLKRIQTEKREYLEEQKKQKKNGPKKMRRVKTSLLDVIRNNFDQKDFTYDDLKRHCDLSYDDMRSQLFELLEKGEHLKSAFDLVTEEIKYIHTQ